jgi:hypothetical protein
MRLFHCANGARRETIAMLKHTAPCASATPSPRSAGAEFRARANAVRERLARLLDRDDYGLVAKRRCAIGRAKGCTDVASR